MVNTERARIEIDLGEATTHIDEWGQEVAGADSHDYNRYGIKITNHGRTVAQIISYRYWRECSGGNFDPDGMQDFYGEERHMLLGADKSATIDNFDFPNLFSKERWDSIRDNIKSGMLRIDVLYEDIIRGEIDGVPPKPHRTMAVFCYDPQNEELRRLPRYNVYE
jgi:hypothetical protein